MCRVCEVADAVVEHQAARSDVDVAQGHVMAAMDMGSWADEGDTRSAEGQANARLSSATTNLIRLQAET